MKLHEYQGKALLRKAGLPVPRSEVIFSVAEVQKAMEALGGQSGVAKAQAFTGGRGKAGGIQLFQNVKEAEALADKMLGMKLITHQTGPEGVKIEALLLEEQSKVTKEMYLAVTLDRAKANIVFILSPEGGMDIEEVADKTPEKILKLHPEWGTGPDEAMIQKASAFLGILPGQAAQFADIMRKLYFLYVVRDASLLEINPLAVDASGQVAWDTSSGVLAYGWKRPDRTEIF